MSTCLSDEFDGFIFLGNPYFLSTWVASLILKVKRKPFYFWTHGLLKYETGIKGLIRRIFHKLPSGLLLYGNHAKKLLIQQGIKPMKLHVIYNSLNYKLQVQLRDSLSIDDLYTFKSQLFNNPELPQLLFIGRLTKQKKLNQIIEAMYLLHQKGCYINLLVVGAGSEEQCLRKLILEKRLESSVIFYGASYDEEVNYKLIASSDICISPGEVGLTAIHSLGYGTPVITHCNFEEQMPEFEAIEGGITGDFFEQDNITDLVLKIQSWLSHHSDRVEVQKKCYNIIDTLYNPQFQREELCKVLLK